MKRKTNLFYLSGDDANFLTFSNYAESLTGVILSTDNKIFPSKFLCFNIDLGESDKTLEDAKRLLREYLISYYENKLAVLRDYCINKNWNPDKKIKPLNYLLETFNLLKEKEGIEIKFVYLGEISEQDYNGTFNDMICTIDSSEKRKGEIEYKEENNNTVNEELIVTFNDIDNDINYNLVDLNHLYGWYSSSEVKEDGSEISLIKHLPESWTELSPIFDYTITEDENTISKYYIDSNIKGISYDKSTESDESIIFDLVIPLYDLIDINYQNNFMEQDENIKYVSLEENGDDLYNYNIPYGIWIGKDKIELKRDDETKMGPSWSLVLSSQFKPFPYSESMPNELEISGKPDAYYTFAQILARQNEILDEFNKLNNNLIDINKRLVTLETKVNTVGTSYTTEILNKNMMVWEQEMLNKYNNLENTLYSYLDNLNWKFRNG